jgi:hypothetical protein
MEGLARQLGAVGESLTDGGYSDATATMQGLLRGLGGRSDRGMEAQARGAIGIRHPNGVTILSHLSISSVQCRAA